MRIVGGTLRGKKLFTPQSESIRPTTDRVRETIFNILAHNSEIGRILKPETRALDAYAGSGALGIEALSRGLGHVTFSDLNTTLLLENLKACNLEKWSSVLKGDAATLLFQSQYDLIFLDPPYGKGLIEKTLKNLWDQNAVSQNAIFICEFQKDETIQWPENLTLITERTISISKIVFLKVNSLPSHGK